METIYHLIIELIKISILGCLYASLILVTFKTIGFNKPGSWFDIISRKKLRLWFLSGSFISAGLFFFMFTYYGDHGLGDSARIPVGHRRAIQEVNGIQAYIQDEGPVNSLDIEKFIITNDYVYGLMGVENLNYEGKYFIYDLINNKIKTFMQEQDFTAFLIAKNLNTKPDYKDFSYYYNEHWGGWRLWLLA